MIGSTIVPKTRFKGSYLHWTILRVLRKDTKLVVQDKGSPGLAVDLSTVLEVPLSTLDLVVANCFESKMSTGDWSRLNYVLEL